MAELTGRRILVVGASSGVGKAVVAELTARGAHVAGAARRAQLVDAKVALACDVRDPSACVTAVDWAVAGLGGLDGLIYATGASPLKRLATMTADEWVDLMRTNVIGASLITGAAIRHLERGAGRAVYLSSSSVPTPLPGLGAYASSKAALEALVRAWNAEHPNVSFRTFVVGPTMTGFADGWDHGLLGELLPSWDGVLDTSEMRQPESVAKDIVDLLESGAPEPA